MNSPELIESSPRMLVASIRLYGDHEFVRSTESLIRVHAELHHSGVIDSTDYREQMCYRVTRGSEAEACLVISFMPVRLSVCSPIIPPLATLPARLSPSVPVPCPPSGALSSPLCAPQERHARERRREGLHRPGLGLGVWWLADGQAARLSLRRSTFGRPARTEGGES